MLRKLSPLFFFLLLFTACDRENFDLIDEEELPDELVVVEEEADVFFRSAVQDRDTVFSIGRAQYSELTNTMLLLSSEEVTFDCPTEEDRSFGYESQGAQFAAFAIFDDDRELVFVNVEYGLVVDGELYRAILSPCTPQETTLDWEGEEIAGSVTVETMPFDYFLESGTPQAGDCDNFPRQTVSFDFRMPVNFCE